ncbi:hypothetical protein PR202_gb03587 [Eleusine coracana subsp. coracana]|uniref:Uncharacterized protein n=1 Tax=Eleusine coracana subsp. coracana TaxID=191504 RepID=A0AAV5E0P2_ELECO|nr:hypothetical protein PR202_gb03587 [Eleusine coracana subsp. coracana]
MTEPDWEPSFGSGRGSYTACITGLLVEEAPSSSVRGVGGGAEDLARGKKSGVAAVLHFTSLSILRAWSWGRSRGSRVGEEDWGRHAWVLGSGREGEAGGHEGGDGSRLGRRRRCDDCCSGFGAEEEEQWRRLLLGFGE